VPLGPPGGSPRPPAADLSRLFHRLNNQLGVVLANAELLEKRVADDGQRARAAQIVSGVLEAIATVQRIRRAASGDIEGEPARASKE
jgi:hypothetical protein